MTLSEIALQQGPQLEGFFGRPDVWLILVIIGVLMVIAAGIFRLGNKRNK